ncbi:endoglucanase 1 isoform X1 [Selaginella moellendorffii]|uniref:endoglucanase 1 isoform X1 n=1 Tax=Selaginella moellendorffii TaxID=88036 RepID=UPI000D1D005E|nr:endoglucanase 1 isoform X1 [Selaginella moellendorffii]|eukprot:XP_024520496.1 endoglucanase 1 isoform X1 [Selaginella moellendorffii]
MAASSSSSLILIFGFVLFTAMRVEIQAQALQSLDYRDALAKSILFYEGMRSGKLPTSQRIKWRANSGMSDGRTANVNLTGGYYDSGDNVKFGFPMAFTITLLSWSVVEFEAELGRAAELDNARAAIRWGTDYLLSAFVPPSTLWVQVGDPNADHQCWERPEDMDTPRTCYQVNPSKPGSDVAGETAAALAAASIVFAATDSSYSQRLLATSKQIFAFADKYRGSYSDVLGGAVSPFYTSYSGYRDELLWGAAWIFRASSDKRYLDYISQHGDELGGPGSSYNTLSWDNKYAGVDVLLSKFILATTGSDFNVVRAYKSRADDFVCSAMPGRATITPGGLFYHGGSNNLQYVTSNAFLLITYGRYLAQAGQSVSCGGNNGFKPGQLISFAKQQVDYILGSNPRCMSYMVGFGTKFPQRVHHRASSLPSIRTQEEHISCSGGFNWLHSSNPNPNILIGAVIGGPDGSDNFSDNRDDFSQAEPSTYANSGLVGALAYFASTAAGNNLRGS